MRKTGKKRLTIILILAFVAAVLLFVLGAWLIVTGVGELLSAHVSPSKTFLFG